MSKARTRLYESTFVGVIEPYEGTSNIRRIRRLPLETEKGEVYPASYVALEVGLTDGCCDLFVAADVEDPLGLSPVRSAHPVMVQKEWGLRFDGEVCMVRRDAAGKVQQIAACRGSAVRIGDVMLDLKRDTDFINVIAR